MDWNLSKLRPKRLKNELYELIINPKDAYYFPYTVRMLSSWNYPNMEEKLKEYIRNDYTRADFGFNENSIKIENIDWLKLMKKSLLKTGLENLRYYPSEENIDILKKYVDYKEQEIQKTAKKSLDKMQVQIR